MDAGTIGGAILANESCGFPRSLGGWGWGCTLHAEDSPGYDEKQADVKQGGGLFVHNDERTAH